MQSYQSLLTPQGKRLAGVVWSLKVMDFWAECLPLSACLISSVAGHHVPLPRTLPIEAQHQDGLTDSPSAVRRLGLSNVNQLAPVTISAEFCFVECDFNETENAQIFRRIKGTTKCRNAVTKLSFVISMVKVTSSNLFVDADHTD
jgi:hypothetical protein